MKTNKPWGTSEKVKVLKKNEEEFEQVGHCGQHGQYVGHDGQQVGQHGQQLGHYVQQIGHCGQQVGHHVQQVGYCGQQVGHCGQ